MEGFIADAFAESSRFFVETVAAIPEAGWDEPGLGTWSIRELVGHANRQQRLAKEYFLHPVDPPPAADGPYFSPEAIAERGREAVALLGDDPYRAVVVASKEGIDFVLATDAEAAIGTAFGKRTLAEYLPSRTAELTIHALDLLKALGVRQDPPSAALAQTMQQVTERVLRKQPVEVLFALTGRGTLPEGYSVY